MGVNYRREMSMKKTGVIVICLMALVVAVSLASCGSDPAGAGVLPSGEKYPAETVKIGVVAFDPSAEQFLAMKSYFEYLKTKINLDFIYSEAIGNAEGELAFIESCAAAGCKAIIGYFNVARVASVQLCIDKGMYYIGVAEEPSVYDAFKDDPFYLGGWYNETQNYDAGYEMGKALIDAGSTRLVYVSGGRDYGVQMFIERSSGFMDAIKDAKAEGKDVTLVADVGGWPELGTYKPAQDDAIQQGFDGLGCSFGAATWYQALLNAGMSDSVKIAAIDAFSDLTDTAWNSGQMACTPIEITSMFGAGIPMLLNSLEGDLDVARNNGQAARLEISWWLIKTADEFNAYSAIETGGIWCWNAEDILSVVKAVNPNATFQDIADLYSADSIEEIEARRSAQGL